METFDSGKIKRDYKKKIDGLTKEMSEKSRDITKAAKIVGDEGDSAREDTMINDVYQINKSIQRLRDASEAIVNE